MPLRLFKEPAFTFTSAVSLLIGFALFGFGGVPTAVLAGRQGCAPTALGLQMLPQMGGTLATSIRTGQLISRFGRHKLFPVEKFMHTLQGLARELVSEGQLASSRTANC